MKLAIKLFIYVTCAILALGAHALALPTTNMTAALSPRMNVPSFELWPGALTDDPAYRAVRIGDLATSTFLDCGRTCYDFDDIWDAITWAMLVEGAGIKRGWNRYPHSLNNMPSGTCGQKPTNMLYPLRRGTVFNGDPSKHDAPGTDRVVFTWQHTSIAGYPKAVFCGGATHHQQPGNGLVECRTVTDPSGGCQSR